MELAGQRVVLIGGSAGIGLETARLAKSQGAEVILTGRHPERLEEAVRDVGAAGSAAFDANDADALRAFFDGLPAPIDHVLVTAGGPRYRPLLEMDAEEVRQAIADHPALALEVARHARAKMPPGGSLVLMGGTGARKPINSNNTPTPMNDTMRSTPPTCDRSTMNNFSTTTASSAAPAPHATRHRRRLAKTIVASARQLHNSDSDTCTSREAHSASTV